MKALIALTVVFLLVACTVDAAVSSRRAGVAEEEAGAINSVSQLRDQIVSVKRDVDYLMKDVLQAYPWGEGMAPVGAGSDIKIDMVNADKSVYVTADMPGMNKSKIDVTLEDGQFLTISGTRDVVIERTEPGLIMNERSSEQVQRTIKLPVKCKTKGIKAKYKNGVLQITIPKAKKSEKDVVTIDVQ